MDRRAVLQHLGLAATVGLLAGCTERADPGRVGERTTQAGGTDFPDGPKSPPDRPDPLTRESVSAYAREYEHRYVYNRLWTDGADVDVSCNVASVEQYADGYRVTVYCEGSSKTSGETPEGGTGTTTLEYGHYGRTRTILLVDDDTTIRLAPDDVTRTVASWSLSEPSK